MIIYDSGTKEYKNFLIKEDVFDESNLAKTESIMCQGNGYICVRGYAEESYPKKTANTFIAGTFNKTFETEVTELPNTADTFSLDIYIDGERFFLANTNVSNYDKTLNLKTGELTRTFKYATKDNTFDFKMSRFVSSDNLHLIASKIEITPLEKDCKIEINSGINSRVSNSGESHFNYISGRFFDKKIIQTKLQTTQSKYDFTINAYHRAFVNGIEDYTMPKPEMERRRESLIYTFDLKAKNKATLEKYATYYTSVDNKEICSIDMDSSYKELVNISKVGYDGLFIQSMTALDKKLWNTDYIEINSKNEFDQLAINFALYHLNVMTPAHDDRMNIGAKGLSGEGYKGHTFWDTEIFMLPKFILQNPQVAKNLLIYRYKGLQGAKKKAQENDLKGAMFPWEAANPEDGEVTPIYNSMDPFTGEREIVKTGIWEIHITSDVAFGVYSYFNFTGDIEFMKKYGYEILLQTAIFWNSRLETNENDDMLHINGVIGPDEYSEFVNDNAYTNYLAKWNMEYAIQIFDDLKNGDKTLFEDLCWKTDIDKEIATMRSNIDKIYLPTPDKDLIIDQDTTYRNLEEIDLGKYKNADKVGLIYNDYNLEQMSKFKVSKQADIMVLFFLFGEKWNNQIKKANFEYYEPYCLHDSSLSFSTYSILANDIGNTKYSYELFNKACLIDLCQHMNSSDAGIHSASFGGVWQCIVNGFAGFRMIGNEFHINPKLPEEINSIKFNFNYNQQTFTAQINKNSVKITNKGSKSENLFIYGKKYNFTDTIEVDKNKIEFAIFDLDGVLVDTAKYHYLAWKKIANEMGFEFTELQNEDFKGVSRMACMDIMCKLGDVEDMPQDKRVEIADKKNNYYLDFISSIDESELLTGVKDTLTMLKENGIKIGLGSASKNAIFILEKTNIIDFFDVIIDGTKVSKAKPDPEVFVLGAKSLGIEHDKCVVIEDAFAGVQAAKFADMQCIGIGSKENLPNADVLLDNVGQITLNMLNQ